MESAPKISQIHFTQVCPREGLIGFVNFVIDDLYAVGGVGVHTRLNKDGIRLLYPNKQLPNGNNVNLFYPLIKDVGNAIEEIIFDKLKHLGGLK